MRRGRPLTMVNLYFFLQFCHWVGLVEAITARRYWRARVRLFGRGKLIEGLVQINSLS